MRRSYCVQGEYNLRVLRNFFFLIALSSLILASCSLTPNTPEVTDLPSLIPSATVPPLPTVTPWATKTPQPTKTATPTPLACWGQGGTLVEDRVPSTLLPDPVQVLVYLPPCYHELTTMDYPSVYLLHGQTFDQTQWVKLGFTATADAWAASGIEQPFLIVMPLIADWTGPQDYPFGQAVVEEVIPYIQEHYRVRPEREWRKVGGISRGGSWALHLGLKYWDQFSAVGGHSAPVFYDDAPRVPSWLDAIPLDLAPGIYLDYAESDQSAIRRSANDLMEELDEREIPYIFLTGPGIHNETYWASQVEDYFAFYLSTWE